MGSHLTVSRCKPFLTFISLKTGVLIFPEREGGKHFIKLQVTETRIKDRLYKYRDQERIEVLDLHRELYKSISPTWSLLYWVFSKVPLLVKSLPNETDSP